MYDTFSLGTVSAFAKGQKTYVRIKTSYGEVLSAV